MTDKLALYNGALAHLGPVRLTSLTESRPDRIALDQAYPKVLQSMLEEGIWEFALRTIEWLYDTDIEPLFGYPYGFSLPDDFIRIRRISEDEYQQVELTKWHREKSYIYANPTVLYLTYVSNDENYGTDPGLFPQLYADAFEYELAKRSGIQITHSEMTRDKLITLSERALAKAKAKNALDEPVRKKPVSSWVQRRNVTMINSDQRREST